MKIQCIVKTSQDSY